MTAVARGGRAQPPFVAIVVYTLRSCLPGRRWVGAIAAAVASILFGFLGTTGSDPAVDAFAGVAADALFGLVLPVTCLVIGDAVLGAEVRAGAFAFTWLSPVPTWQITVGRWLGGTLAAASISAVAFALSAMVAEAPESAGAVALSAVFGSMAYVAIFLAIGCMTNRAAVWSLAYVFLVERLAGSELSGIAQLSPSWEARAVFMGLTDAPDDLIREGIPHGTAALVRLVIITAVVLVFATSRIRHLRFTGSAD